MADRDLRLRILMDAADRVTRPLRDITGGAGRAAEALRGTRQALQRINDQQAQLTAFSTLRNSMRSSATAMREAQQRTAALGRELAQSANPTRAMQRAFEAAKREEAQLTAQHRAQTQQLQDLRTRLREAGVNTRDLSRHERELGDQARETTERMEQQERELERLTRRQQRFGAARDRFNRTMGTAQNVAGAGMGMLATAGAMALPIVAGVKAAQEYESVMTDIGQKANLSRAATAAMGADLLRAARAANQLPDAMQGGVDTLAGFGLDPRQATQMMKPIGKAATAYKAEIADLAAASFAAHDNLKIPIEQTERMIDGMAAAGKAGAFEMKDMAQYFPSLTAAYQGLGQKGVAAGVDLASALQITRKGAGDSATAAGNLQNVLQKITSPATVRAFKKMGVDLPASLKKMYAEGKGPIEAIAELTNKTLKGDLSKMGYLFEDAQVQGGLRPLIQNMEEYRRIREEAGNASGTTNTDFAERMRDSAEQTKQLTVNATTLAIQLGTVLLPTVNDLLGKAAAMASRIGDWSQRNPGLTKTLVLAAVAITALTGAAALMTLGYAAAMGPMALFGALSTATGIGLLPIIGTVLAVVAAIALLSYGAYKLYQNWDGIVGWFSGLWQRVRAVFVDNWQSIRNLLLGAVVIFMPPVAAMAWLVSVIYRNWDTIRAGFTAGLSYLAGIVAPFTTPFMRIVTFLVGLQSRFAQMGLNLIQGLGRGILSGVRWVIGLITNVASTLGGAFAKAMGIKSPSRVFMAYGGHLMSGLHNGIDADAAAPVGRMTRLSRDLTDALDVGSRTPTLAGRAPGAGGGSPYPGISPRTGPAAGGTTTYIIKVEGGTGGPDAIEAAVRRAIENVEREKAAQGRSRFGDQPDWSA